MSVCSIPGGHDRLPPANLHAEASVLGAVLFDAATLDAAREWLAPTDFYAAVHEKIFAAMTALADAHRPIDKVAVAEELRRHGELDHVGGLAYLNGLTQTISTAASITYHAQLVREKALLRGLIHAGSTIAALGYDGEDDPADALLEAERTITAISERGVAPPSLPEPGAVLDALVARMVSHESIRVIRSPWRTLNRIIGGFTPGELVGVVAAAKVGKTGFAVTLAEYVAETCGPFAFFATEMGDEGIERRRIAVRSGVSARKQRLGELTESELELVVAAARELRNHPLAVLGRRHRTLRGIWRACREIRTKRGPLAGICVDHVGFLDESQAFGKERTETQALDGVYRALLDLATDFDCPVFVVVHPNREGAVERPSRATLHKIRGGGALENHAHTIICPWRSDPLKKPNDGEVIVVASRDGGEGALPFWYEGARAAWYEMERDKRAPLWFEGAPSAQGVLQFDPDRRRDLATEVDGIPARIVAHHDEYDDLEDARRLFGSTN